MINSLLNLFGRSISIGLLMVIASSLMLETSSAQLAPPGVFRIRAGVIELTSELEDAEPATTQGAVLKTDPDLEAILAKADRFKNDGNYRVATQLWQAVLERSGDALYSSDGKIYFSLVRQVEAILADLPDEGLTSYRVIADAAAKEILAQSENENDESALNQIVQRYFVSSLGDDAAFKLGCLYLDRYDFIGARRVFEKIIYQHPDPSVSLADVYTRIALCQSYLGDLEMAKKSLDNAEKAGSTGRGVSLVRKSLGELGQANSHRLVKSDWKMRLGGPSRYGVMPGLSDDWMNGDLTAKWQFYYDPRNTRRIKAASVDGWMLCGASAFGDLAAATQTKTEKTLVRSWQKKGWRPAGHLLFDEDRVYFKTATDLSAWDRSKIAKIAKTDGVHEKHDAANLWRSVWHNSFATDDATLMRINVRRGGFNRGGRSQSISGPLPASKLEVQLFGDEIYQQMSTYRGNVFSIEGTSFDDKHVVKSVQNHRHSNSFRRTRSNFLTCYDAVTGEVKWRLPKQSQNKTSRPGDALDRERPEWLDSGGFMAAPIGYGDLLIAPVNEGGAIAIYAFDLKNQGKTVWSSFLCDEPETGAVGWSAINLSIDGSDLFVNCGMGAVFVLDPATGTVRFAKRYKRVGQSYASGSYRSTVTRKNFDGWSNDVVIPYRSQMICFSSDNKTIEAYNRNSGKLEWRSEYSPSGIDTDYILGIYDNVLYTAGQETILAYDLTSDGAILWGGDALWNEGSNPETPKRSLGRGVLTPTGIYMPVEDGIYRFGLKSDKYEAKVQVDLGGNAPVGNLYSDGEHLWVHGGNRIYMLGPAEQ